MFYITLGVVIGRLIIRFILRPLEEERIGQRERCNRGKW